MPDTPTTVISTKGQVILPIAIRNGRHWTAGTKLTVEETPEGVLLKAVPTFAPSTVKSVFGSMYHEGMPLTLDEMNQAIDKEAKRRARG